MRLLILIIVVFLLAFLSWRQFDSATTTATVDGEPASPLGKAQKMQQEDYLEALDRHREQLDSAEESERP